MSNNAIKIIGCVLSVISAGMTIATNYIDDKKMDAKIAEKVNEALAKAKKN